MVIGGDAAGMSAASQARRRRPADDLAITVFEQSGWVSYSACGEPYHIAGDVPRLEQLVVRTPDQFASQSIDVHIHHQVTEIDTAAGSVTVSAPDGTATFGYDQLMYATGAEPVEPAIEGKGLDGVFTLKSLDDAAAIKSASARARHAVVVGGGYIGLEVAEAFVRLGIETVLVTSGGGVMNRTLDVELSELATDEVRKRGMEVVTGLRVSCLSDRAGRVTGVQCDDTPIAADLVVLGLGTRPMTQLAADAGIPLGPTGAVAVDDRQRTRVEGIWSAGDCAEAYHRLTGHQANVHLGTVANKQGRVAGINLGGGNARFPGILGTAITKFLDLEISRTGLGESEAAAYGFDVVSAITESTTTAGYWPEAAPMTIKVTAERGTGRLLGAQIVGGHGAGKRIDTLATGIWNEMDGHSFSMMDLSYAPPFSSTWDPVLIAARKAADQAT